MQCRREELTFTAAALAAVTLMSVSVSACGGATEPSDRVTTLRIEGTVTTIAGEPKGNQVVVLWGEPRELFAPYQRLTSDRTDASGAYAIEWAPARCQASRTVLYALTLANVADYTVVGTIECSSDPQTIDFVLSD